jgi:hypothetical protein
LKKDKSGQGLEINLVWSLNTAYIILYLMMNHLQLDKQEKSVVQASAQPGLLFRHLLLLEATPCNQKQKELDVIHVRVADPEC